jgi:glycosyltransferase involved in cell wall biosynthesis
MSKLLVINQYYAPDVASTGQLAAEICENLAASGTEVHVVTGQPSYTADSVEAPAYEIRNGVHIHRIEVGIKGRERRVERILGYVKFLLGANRMARAIVNIEKPESILTFHNPPFVGWIGARLARKHNLRFTYAPYDIHPDVLIATGWLRLPRPIIWLWEAVNRYIFGSARSVIALGEGMRNTLIFGKGVSSSKVQVVPLWGRPEFSPATRDAGIRAELGIDEHAMMLLYSGNMGIMHHLEEILDAAAELRDAPVRFVFVGDGAKRETLLERVERNKLCNVQFLPFQTEERFARLVAASDVCLVVLEPGLEKLAVPSRSFTFLSAGKPLMTLMSPEADVARLITENFAGWNTESGDQMATQIGALLDQPKLLRHASENARRLYEARFTREKVLEKYRNILAA